MTDLNVELSDVRAEMDDVENALFEAALRRAIARKQATVLEQQQERIEELEAPATTDPADG